MGLIRDVLLGSGGLIAGNKLASSFDGRGNQAQDSTYPQNYQRGSNYAPRDSWETPVGGPTQHGRPQDGYYDANQGQSQWGPPTNCQQYGQTGARSDSDEYVDPKYPSADSSHEYQVGQGNDPPPYSQQPQSYGMPPHNQNYDQNQNYNQNQSQSDSQNRRYNTGPSQRYIPGQSRRYNQNQVNNPDQGYGQNQNMGDTAMGFLGGGRERRHGGRHGIAGLLGK